MNRRRFFIALAILVPLAIFGAAKWATRMRPVKIGAVLGAPSAQYPVLIAGQSAVIAGDGYGPLTWFDLAKGTRRLRGAEGLSNDGMATWSLRAGAHPQLEVRRDEVSRFYDLPRDVVRSLQGSGVQGIIVSDAPEYVNLFVGNRFSRWRTASRHLERDVRSKDVSGQLVTRDAAFMIDVNLTFIRIISARSGDVARRIALTGELANGVRLSGYGSYIVYVNPKERSCFIVSATSRARWDFVPDDSNLMVFSTDETELALARGAARIWEIRESKTGQILRTLPLVPDCAAAAFSPDGQTLYSLAGGVLYRQRAR